jgi:translation elongation factor EF-1alpha
METMKWARAKFDELRQFIEPMLWELEFSIANTMFIPVSGLEGHNLVKPFSKIQ